MDMEKELRYVVAGSKAWNRTVFNEVISGYPGEWHLVSVPEDLTLELLQKIKPAYIFFLHWSWKVPPEIICNHKCVCFHMTDVPYGRGGSPLQNLISRGHRQTKLTALLMVDEFDAGPVYLKEPLCLEGNAEEIFIRATYLSAKMIKRIIAENLQPVFQTGETVIFKRRTPEQSRIEKQESLQALHDFIRMLDAEGYPKSFLEYEGFRYEFSRAALYDERIKADVVITPIKEKD
jgi:methionyl-tRNA formyltransferase